MRISNLKLGAAATALIVALSAAPFSLGAGPAFAADEVIPPPLNRAQAKYFAAHPAEYNALLATAPRARTVAPPPAAPVAAGTWSGLTHAAPGSGLANPLLLTDGTVLVHVNCSATWYKLSPDSKGSYINGTWSTIAAAPWAPLYFASQILNDGRVVGNGGEYDGNQGCTGHWITGGGVYNPVNNTWVSLAPPTGWTTIGDAQSVILPNTKYMLANCCTTDQALLNPTTLTWTATGSGKADINDEEGWALLHDGTVMTADASVGAACGTNTERYTPSTGAWTSAGNATTQLSDCLSGGNFSYEVGPVVVRPNGTAVAFSGVTSGPAGTSIYNPTSHAWGAGPNLPVISGAQYNLADAPAVALPSGGVLFAASPGLFSAPVHFFEFTGTNTIVQRTDTPNAPGNASYVVNMLMLPTGQVLQTDMSNAVEIYTPFGTYQAAWQPVVTSVPTALTRGSSYTVTGKQLNGITHGVYGDDAQAATNFPLVQLTNTSTGNVYYARTSRFSNRSDQPNSVSSATFSVPVRAPAGAYTLTVVANGIPSAPTSVTLN